LTFVFNLDICHASDGKSVHWLPEAFIMITLSSVPDRVAAALPPGLSPLRLIAADGSADDADEMLVMPSDEVLVELLRRMIIGRRFDTQATALTKQGRLAVYPSSRGQEACQVGAVLALREQDWLFPTYRDTMAVITRSVAAAEALSLLRGEWHCGYDPYERNVAPQCTPLATHALHAVGLAYAARVKRADQVALVLLGDGATSEGDTHEALNFAAVWRAPTVFLVQNNGYAISVPLAKQTAAPALAYKGVGYGMRSLLIDGNDAAAVYAAVSSAVTRAASGDGPTLIEALTYRVAAHTNADDATRYRDSAEVDAWLDRDPLRRLETYLRGQKVVDDGDLERFGAEAERFAAEVRTAMSGDMTADPAELFAHVYAEPTRALAAQREFLFAELAGRPS
jgi:2-oxoisovalerate dehydrogenase E1 component alpha subunit